MRVYAAKAAVAAMILGCCASAQAKKQSQKEDPLTRRTFNAPIESVYGAAVAVAGGQWSVISSDPAAHSLSFETTNTRQEVAGGYSTYSVSVTCMATPAGGTAVSLEVTEHGSSQPSLGALINKSQRRAHVLQDFWDGVEAALKKSATPQAPTPAVQSPSAAPPATAPAQVTAPERAPPPAAAPEAPPPALPKTPKLSAAGELAVVAIKSTPEGADITIDGKFFGDTPTTARLAAGDYAISIAKAGYKPWERTVTLTEGGTVTLDVTLEGTR